MIKISNEKGEIIAERILRCDTFFKRAMGLMFKKSMEGFDGALLSPCSSIHTFFMRFDIDCIFLDERYRVVKVISRMGASRMSGFIKNASHVLEIASGASIKCGIAEGDLLKIEDNK